MMSIPDKAVEATDEVMKGARAIVSLTHATPGILGSSYSDAVDIWSEDRASPTAAQEKLRTAAERYAEWRRRIAAYWGEASDDSLVIPAYQERVNQWRNVGKDSICKETLRRTLADVDDWKKRLRDGGCNYLIQVIVDSVKTAWANSGGKEDTAGATAMEFRDVAELLRKYTTDPGFNELRQALRSKTASMARDEALATFAEIVAKYRGGDADMPAQLHELHRATLLATKIPKPSEVLDSMHNCRGFLSSALAKHVAAVSQRSDVEAKIAEQARDVIKVFASELTGPGFQSVLAQEALEGFDLALSLKTAISDLKLDLDDGGAPAAKNNFTKYYEAKRAWGEFADKARGSNASVKAMDEHMTKTLAENNQLFSSKADETLQSLLADVGKAKARLDRVAGGLDNGKLWKAELKADVKLHDPAMEAACRVVGQAFCTAIETRTADLKKVELSRQSASKGQPAIFGREASPLFARSGTFPSQSSKHANWASRPKKRFAHEG